MQAKIFLNSLLVTLLTAHAIASPTGLEARDAIAQDIGDPGFDNANSAGDTNADLDGEVKPLPDITALIPSENDIPVAATGVEARDLENLEKRTPGCILVTSDRNFRGRRLYTCPPRIGRCYNWNSYWRSRISSFRPDRGTTCRIYTGTNCGGIISNPFGYPGYSNLGRWNDNMGSFRCWW
ncbi:hypothetical protein HOY80DRAFT_914715 [Tuber brumale]|nr:hypothetical protein HOY80DRAFT_914715 [Tuber brumale]